MDATDLAVVPGELGPRLDAQLGRPATRCQGAPRRRRTWSRPRFRARIRTGCGAGCGPAAPGAAVLVDTALRDTAAGAGRRSRPVPAIRAVVRGGGAGGGEGARGRGAGDRVGGRRAVGADGARQADSESPGSCSSPTTRAARGASSLRTLALRCCSTGTRSGARCESRGRSSGCPLMSRPRTCGPGPAAAS